MSKPDAPRRKPETEVVTAGRNPLAHHGAVNPPVYHVSTLLHPTMESLEKRSQTYSYGRRGSPTSQALSDAINRLEGGAGCVLAPSGYAAVTLALMSVLHSGDHLLVTDNAYGPTRAFCDKILTRFGVETTYYEPTIGAGVAELMRKNTRAVFCESPGSLTFEVQDIPAISQAAHKGDAVVIADNTWATPLLFDAFAHGVDMTLHAATKYIVGHSDAMLGVVTANNATWKQLRDTHGNLGMHVGPDDVYLGQRGLRTMAIRLKQHEETALALAHWLQRRAEVARVLYPALPDDPGHSLWRRDFTGASGLFGVELKPVSHTALASMLDHLELFGMGWSWGGYESLMVPAHPTRTARPLKTEGPLLRIHAGLEAVDDLIADLDAGFARLNNAS
ncbi:MAG: cystathionine beta-lyase [Alphaproteobacteria bacterium]|nr:cystathionine beta-lyase [Alphaproteobacteria bacterium]